MKLVVLAAAATCLLPSQVAQACSDAGGPTAAPFVDDGCWLASSRSGLSGMLLALGLLLRRRRHHR